MIKHMDPYFILAILFTLVLILNLFLRLKVLKDYKTLTRDRVDFSMKQMLNEKLLKEEVLPKYPQHKDTILSFSRNVKRSMLIASIILIFIIFFALQLFRNR